jgi:RNA polymerase sigma-70 factor (ECF subfamily)
MPFLTPGGLSCIFVLVDVECMTYEEAAAVVRVPIGTVKSRLARARMQMRKALQSFGDLLRSRIALVFRFR